MRRSLIPIAIALLLATTSCRYSLTAVSQPGDNQSGSQIIG